MTSIIEAPPADDTVVDMPVSAHAELIELLDQFITTTAHRNLIPSQEVQDIALDMRNVVTRMQTEEVPV